MPAPPPSRLGAYLLLTASMALVGSYVALSKPLLAVFPVLVLALLRFAIAAVAMLPWTGRAADEPPLSRSEHLQLFLMSFFGNFLFSIAMLNGIARTTATAAGVILATLPAVVAVLSWLLLRERLGARVLIAIALAVGGIALLQFARGGEAGGDRSASLLGNALMLAAVVCEAIYVIFARRLANRRAPLRVSALINLWGLALIAPWGLWQWTRLRPDLSAVDAQLWLLLVFYALAASLVAVWLWMAGMKQVAASEAGVFTVALPITATLVGVLLLGEHFSLLHALALLLASAGAVLIATAPGAAAGGAGR
ncbi:MAG: DMT family transporter [Burkholderiaceae bacterium]|jgi:drug/metabolite transporter (DMT)-like permease|nr:DMT family transporter [Burkholderiaceae bacterium]